MTSLIRPGAKGIKVAAAALVLAVLAGGVASAGRPADAPTGDEKPQPGWEGMKRGGPEMPIERIVLTLVLILGGGAAAFWALRRFGPARRGAFGPGGSTDMKLVGRLPLGVRDVSEPEGASRKPPNFRMRPVETNPPRLTPGHFDETMPDGLGAGQFCQRLHVHLAK